MSKLEKGMDANEATKTLNPCWSAYNIADKYALSSVFCTIALRWWLGIVITKKNVVAYRRAPAVYVNLFTGQVTTQFPRATGTARGGVSLFQLFMCLLCIIFPKVAIPFPDKSHLLTVIMPCYMLPLISVERIGISITPILQHDPVSRIRYVSVSDTPIHLCAFNFCRNLTYPHIRILPISIRVSVSVLHSLL